MAIHPKTHEVLLAQTHLTENLELCFSLMIVKSMFPCKINRVGVEHRRGIVYLHV